MLAEYLTIARPFEIFLSHKFKCKGANDLNEFLWADYKKGRWDGEFLSDLLKVTTSQNKMQSLGFRDYRQVALAFMEKHLKYKVRDIQGLNAILDLQAGHTSRTAAAEYAVSTEDHGKVSREAMHQYYLASIEWSEFMLSYGAEKQEKRMTDELSHSQDQRTVATVLSLMNNGGDILTREDASDDEISSSRMQDVVRHTPKGMINQLKLNTEGHNR